MTGAARPVRVVVAEDSTTTRELLVALLSSDPAIEVVGQASNGAQAVELTTRLRPSLVVMDIHMPVMDGFEATKRIMIDAPTPLMIVTAATNARDVELGLRATQLGALTVLPKPPGPTDPEFPEFARRLISLAKALSEVKVVRRRRPLGSVTRRAVPELTQLRVPEVVAIAASTGGPAAVYRVLEQLPRRTRVPILVVQHMANGFVQGLVRWLSSGTPLPVKLAEDGEPLQPGIVYVAPENWHLEVGRGRRVQLTDGERVEGFRPSATVLFSSLARTCGAGALGLVLTGMGRDGLEGLKELHRAGGQVLAQDEASSVVFGMPGVVVAAGLADIVGSVDELAQHLTTLIGGDDGRT